jgi:hypothetical protein
VPSLADLQRAWLLKQLGLTSANLTEADLQTALYSAQNGWLGQSNNYPLAVGRYYSPSEDVTVGTLTMVLNRMWAVPFNVGRQVTLDRIGLEVTVAGTAGNVIRLGIYDTQAGLPGNRILDAGTVPGDAIATPEIVINQALSPGLYWLAAVSQIQPVGDVRALGAVSSSYVGHTANPGATNYKSYRIDGIAGALPTPFGVPVADSSAPRPVVRISA